MKTLTTILIIIITTLILAGCSNEQASIERSFTVHIHGPLKGRRVKTEPIRIVVDKAKGLIITDARDNNEVFTAHPALTNKIKLDLIKFVKDAEGTTPVDKYGVIGGGKCYVHGNVYDVTVHTRWKTKANGYRKFAIFFNRSFKEGGASFPCIVLDYQQVIHFLRGAEVPNAPTLTGEYQ